MTTAEAMVGEMARKGYSVTLLPYNDAWRATCHVAGQTYVSTDAQPLVALSMLAMELGVDLGDDDAP